MIRNRFERGEPTAGGKIRNRRWPGVPAAGPADALGRGDFLARLWTLFGPPGSVDGDGYTYDLRDRYSGIAFSAYSGASGPAYGGSRRDGPALVDVLDDFERLLDETPLADCSIEFGDERGRIAVGANRGRSFDRIVDPHPDGRVEGALQTARAVLASEPGAIWDDVNALLDLRVARSHGGGGSADDVDATARTLWRRALDTIEELEAGSEWERIAAGDRETVVEVAVEQLREIAAEDPALKPLLLRLTAAQARLRDRSRSAAGDAT